MPGVAIEYADMGVSVKLSYSRSNRCLDLWSAHFVMNDDASHHIRQNAILAFWLKILQFTASTLYS